MNITSMFAYSQFPVTGDKTQMTFGNMMQIMVMVIVVFTSIAGGYLLAIGYLKKEGMKILGTFAFVMSIIITITGLLNPIGMANHWNILGLSERAVIYLLQIMMFGISLYYTIMKKESIN